MQYPVLFYTAFAKIKNENDFYIWGVPDFMFLFGISLDETTLNSKNWKYKFDNVSEIKTDLKNCILKHIDQDYMDRQRFTYDQIYFNFNIYFELDGDEYRSHVFTISYNRLLKWIES